MIDFFTLAPPRPAFKPEIMQRKTRDGERVYQWGMLFVAIWILFTLGGCAWGLFLKLG